MGLFGKNKKKAPSAYTDKHLNGAPQSIGQDSANEVFKVKYGDEYAMAGGETSGYFKPDADMAPAKNAVGASRLAQGMGLGHIIPETKFATHDVTNQFGATNKGVKGAVSKAAKGQATRDIVFDTYKPEYKGTGNDYTKVRPDGHAYELTGFEMNDSFDMSKSNTQQQLNQLQWFDALIGNEDRHGTNIMIDPETGNVTGIDNDLSFSRGVQAKNRDGTANDSFTDGRDSKYLGLPQQLDEETAAKLLALSPKKIKKMLNPKGTPKDEQMSKEELQQVYDRLEVIQAEAERQKEAGSLLKGWDQTTYQDSLNQTRRDGSWGAKHARNYTQRHHDDLQKAKDTANNDYWVKGDRATTAPGSIQTKAPWTSGAKTPPSTSAPFQIGTGRQAPKPSSTAPQKPLPPLPVGATSGPQKSGAQPSSAKPTGRPLPAPPNTSGPQKKVPKVLANSPFSGW
jgi:hypothetical protein